MSGADATPEGVPDGTRSELAGSVGDVVQARDVHGGVHFHGQVIRAAAAPRQLPGDVRGFVNRVVELGQLGEVLADDRGEPHVVAVSVIAGTAGVGKTSLALRWAHQVRDRFPDGELYVNLRGYDPGTPMTPEQALDRFLRALDVPAAAIPADLGARSALFRSLLADRRMLIVLDNAATAGQVRPLIPGTAGCLVVVTSRSRLSGLVARDGAYRLTLDMLTEPEAVELLRAVMSGYRAGDSEAELVELARLCARLPLALRIAAERAARRPGMPLGELIRELRDESALWDALAAEDDEEADAVRTVFAWSYRALPEAAARVFRLLGLHPGSDFGVPAVAALAGISVADTSRQLDMLVGTHLLEQHSLDRYQFHDLLRAYAADQARREETEENRHASIRRVLSWYLHTAYVAATIVGPLPRIALDPLAGDVRPPDFVDRPEALHWCEQEHDNLVAVVRTAAAADLRRVAWQLPVVLRAVYAYRNQFDDWLETAGIALEAVRQDGDRFGEAEVLESLGKAHTQSQQLEQGADDHRTALAIRREIGDRLGEVSSLNGLGLVHLRGRRLIEAGASFAQAEILAREIGDQRLSATTLSNLAAVRAEAGHADDAVSMFRQALTVHRQLGDRAGEGEALVGLARALRTLGRLNEADESIRAAVALAQSLGVQTWEASWLLDVGRIQLDGGEPAEALVAYQRAATLQRRIGDQSREAAALDGTGVAYRALGRFEEAADFHRRAVAMHRELADDWSLAVALDNLATSLDLAEMRDEARPHWRESLTILERFDDPAAAEIRARISGLLSD